MNLSVTYAARMMLALLFACLTCGMSTVLAQDDCCERIEKLEVVGAASDACCFTVSGTVGERNRCFTGWQYAEYINGAWVNDGVTYLFNADGTFSITKCGSYGTHDILLLFVGANGEIICRKELQYTCQPTCCDRIRVYIEPLEQGDRCCFLVKGTVGEGWERCFKYFEYQEFIDGNWVSDGNTYIPERSGEFKIEKCVEPGIHKIRLVFYSSGTARACVKELEYNCEHPCCERIRGPYIKTDGSVEPGRCCFKIYGSVGEGWERCFKWWEYEQYIDGQWVNDGTRYEFDGSGGFSAYRCVEPGPHKIRLLFYNPDGKLICVRETEYNCEHPCCERIKGPFTYPLTSPAPGEKCCFLIKGSVGEGWERCFKWVEYEQFIDGAWVNDGSQYGIDGDGTFHFTRCVEPGSHAIRVLFYNSDGKLICIRELEYNCENECCERIQGPYIGAAHIEPRPGWCCFSIRGNVGDGWERCFKYWQYEEFINGAWVSDGSSYTFDANGNFYINKCVRTGSHTIRIVFYNSDGKVVCVRRLAYDCGDACCERIKGPFIYPAVDAERDRCCFTIKGSVGANYGDCFKWWEYEEFVNGTWVNDGGQYGFDENGTFSITKCGPYGNHIIRILFYNSDGKLVCTKELTYNCPQPCCERIEGPYIYPAVDAERDRCCFTIKGSVGEKYEDCFKWWEYEELVNGTWVNDGSQYSFDGDGTFSITQCRPYGTHIIRILFYSPEGRLICSKLLRYYCPQPCCDRLEGPYVYPAAAGNDSCCFTIKGSVGDNWWECLHHWDYEELINGVWVSDVGNYPFNDDGTFSITKCRSFGTHQIRIVYYGTDGRVACQRELTYTCINPCCETIRGPFIYPADVSTDIRRCCFTIKGSIGECNPCFRYWEYEELIGGTWVNDGVRYLFDADGTFSITKCRSYGTHQVRILFYDHSGKVICVKELEYTCDPGAECCETIDGPYTETIESRVGWCCFRIYGHVRDFTKGCFGSWEIERWADSVWINDGVSYTFDADGNFEAVKCVRPGTYVFRLVFRSPAGEILCVRKFRYHCENDCCERMRGPYISMDESEPGKCCFKVYGVVDLSARCFTSWEFERLVNGVWVNDGVSYPFDASGQYSLGKCLPSGLHQIRIIFRGPRGEIACIKELEVDCSLPCCESIRGPFVEMSDIGTRECCFKIYGAVDLRTRCFGSWEVERYVDGTWVNDGVSYMFDADGSFSLFKCLPSGNHRLRIIFRGPRGQVTCVKEIEVNCEHACCETIRGPRVEPTLSPIDMCCFRIYGAIDPLSRRCFRSWEFERWTRGGWINDGVSYTFNPDGTFSITKCYPIGGTYRMRILFRGYNGEILCIKEVEYSCIGAAKQGTPGDVGAGGNASGMIQQMSAVPNPASDVVMISYEIAEAGQVNLDLFNTAGEKVALIDQGAKGVGMQTVQFSAGTLASGTYYARLMVNGAVVNVPIVIVR